MKPTELSKERDQQDSTSEQVKSAVRRGFLLWSWMGLLGAYISTSTIYSVQLLRMIIQGRETFEFSYYSTLTGAILMFPIMVLVTGWVSFSRYSSVILDVSLLPER